MFCVIYFDSTRIQKILDKIKGNSKPTDETSETTRFKLIFDIFNKISFKESIIRIMHPFLFRLSTVTMIMSSIRRKILSNSSQKNARVDMELEDIEQDQNWNYDKVMLILSYCIIMNEDN